MYYWGGRLHNTPENFVVPKMTLQTLIVYWYCGSQHPAIPPLKYARCWDFKNKNTMRVTLSQMKRMIQEVERAAGYVGFDFGASGRIDSPGIATKLYEQISHLFHFPSHHSTRRFAAMTWKTSFLDLQRNNFRFVGEES
mmetsp:Transcript_14128/g.26499  ORF Transcript_14128/g.26499 Transcript_14128/m.26499 type:complete len:139 (-) Transcript_14128:145-561(-)